MKNIIVLLFTGQWRELMLVPTNDFWLQLFRAIFVGAAAFLVDASILFLLFKWLHIYYLIAASISFFFGLLFNFLVSKKLVFASTHTKISALTEFVSFGLISGIGLLFTLLLMYFFTDIVGLYVMLSKSIAALLVLLWNFTARKFILYRH